MFSDIEGSTSLLTCMGSRWGDALSAHRTLMREAIQAHHGHELGTEGDSFFVVFSSALDALQAAVQAQRGLTRHRWPGCMPLRVRIGLHTGEPQRHEDGYIGVDVHRAARIAATAHGGQIVCSAATRLLVEGKLEEVELRDLGWHRLKDLEEPEHLFDLRAPGLPEELRPLRSLGTPASLPTHSTPLIGRATELAELSELLTRGARLVTLTGPGGTGKTRLAVACAADLQDTFGSVFFVPLHTADRGALVWVGIADAVGAAGESDELPRDRALGFLRGRTALLVLDNLEQIPDADDVVAQLLSEAEGVHLIATSRRPLHLVDEQQLPVAPLAVPEPEGPVRQEGAVELFVERARLVKPGFRLDPDNVTHVAALCRRLDGLPLAIELAAARLRLLSPRALLARLDMALGGGGGAADRAERQRTLASTIAWSYDLLDEDDRWVFRQLGVFSSRVGLDAVAEVVRPNHDGSASPSDRSGGDEGGGALDALDAVAHLVDTSLLEVVEAPDGEPMMYMLETIRNFALAKLVEHGELDDVRLRHARWCREAVEEVCTLLHGPRQMTALDRMEAVEEDVRAALDWALSPEAADSRVRRAAGFALLAPMDLYWYRFGYNAEGRGWHERALALIDEARDADDLGVVDALLGHGVLTVQRNELEAGARTLESALEMAHRLGDAERESKAANSLGIARREGGDVDGARVLIERGIALARSIGNRDREAAGLSNLVHLHLDAGEHSAAAEAARRAIALDEELDNPWGVAISRINLVAALLYAEGPIPAYEQLVATAADAVALGDVELSLDVVDAFAAVLAALGEGETAAVMLGVADAQRGVHGIPRPAPEQVHLDRFVMPARQAVSVATWEQAYLRGNGLTIDDAVGLGCATALAPTIAGSPKEDVYGTSTLHQTATDREHASG